ncbi:hypothetical protein [Trichlorobacter lovleyi]|uniref:Uncharacterized protein n=1 Tax=Trichlorobacter lovleyi (strain ATCC BAA-1151 / DSM 17278 / SZ) TaxID=398767 RepID=B3E4F4_TRIL1|nr:hypothetical protein [Trichlorobacter lovleyi]ACD94469.1 hypothetical protein Glov_0743 [Trichlorobacter lovleyi SZ]
MQTTPRPGQAVAGRFRTQQCMNELHQAKAVTAGVELSIHTTVAARSLCPAPCAHPRCSTLWRG